MNNALETPGDSLAAITPRKAGLEGLQMTQHRPEQFSAMLASRSLLACERLLRLGGVAPRNVTSRPLWSRTPSQMSLRPMACVSWA